MKKIVFLLLALLCPAFAAAQEELPLGVVDALFA